jgi:hypothetical protein
MRARVLYMVPALWCLATPSLAAGPAVAAAETNVTLGAGFAQSSYSEHLTPGDAGTGFTPALTAGAALLFPATGNADYYAALSYRFSGASQSALNFAEARLGGGLPLAGGAEIISYIAAGYQGWTIASNGDASTYSSPLAGAGTKFDMPLTSRLVVSLGAEFLLLAGGSLATRLQGITLASNSPGVTPEEHVELGLDGAAYGPMHVFAQAWVTHFTAAGSDTATGVNLGIGYSFY